VLEWPASQSWPESASQVPRPPGCAEALRWPPATRGFRRPDGVDSVGCIYNRLPVPPTRNGDDARIAMVADECIANKVRLLNRAVTAIYDEALRPHGLKISQMSVLVTVATLGSASPGAVGRSLHMEKSTLSRNVDRMRARGWLEVAAAADGRTTELTVTARGRRLLRDVHPAWMRAQQRAGEMLGDQGVRGFTRTAALVAKARRDRG